ncbi:MAG TPA: hypothetical protein VL995_12255, partial [Cellvibrio sp.]|nr:hypothetical protein [Cellvibrio sp.]
MRIHLLTVLSLALVLSACGGDSKKGGSSTSSSISNTQSSMPVVKSSTQAQSSAATGQTPLAGGLVDAFVSGIGYRTETQSGFTTASGEFKYLPGETVTFFIGDLVFPPVSAKGIVTPLDMAQTLNPAAPVVLNIARLLQSLDTDGNPDNGISISTSAAQAAAAVDFSLSPAQFAASAAVVNLVANSGSTTTTLVSEQQALTHLKETLALAGVPVEVSSSSASSQSSGSVVVVPDSSSSASSEPVVPHSSSSASSELVVVSSSSSSSVQVEPSSSSSESSLPVVVPGSSSASSEPVVVPASSSSSSIQAEASSSSSESSLPVVPGSSSSVSSEPVVVPASSSSESSAPEESSSSSSSESSVPEESSSSSSSESSIPEESSSSSSSESSVPEESSSSASSESSVPEESSSSSSNESSTPVVVPDSSSSESSIAVIESSSSQSSVAPSAFDAANGWASVGTNNLGGTGTTGGVTADEAHTYTVTNRNELLAALYTNLVINTDGSFTGTVDTTPKIIYIDGTVNLNMNKALVEQTEADYICPIDGSSIKVAYNFEDYKNFYDPNGSWGTTAVSGDWENARVCAANKQKAVVQIKVGSNTTIIGKNNNAKIVRGHVRLSPPYDNIIIRNVHFEDAFDMFPQWDPTDSGGRWNSAYDNISVDGATHVWIDHCTFSDGANHDKLYPPVYAAPYNLPEMKVQHHDGAVDVSKNSNYVTLSYNYVHDHDKTHLIGSSDSIASDNGPKFLKITMHHNYLKDVSQRLPRVRMGMVHVYNNLYDGQLKPISVDRSYAFSVGLATGQF